MAHLFENSNDVSLEVTAHGDSMSPRINNGDKITITSVIYPSQIEVGDVVFCKVKGRFYYHLVKARKESGGKLMFLIGNNKGHENGWTSAIYGKVMA